MKSKIFVVIISLIGLIVVSTACDFKLPTANVSNSLSKSNVFIDPIVPETSLDIEIKKVDQQTLSEINKEKEEFDVNSYVNIKEVIKRISVSVVKISTIDSLGETKYFSGVVIGTTDFTKTDGTVVKMSYIVTCHNLIDLANEVKIETIDDIVFDEIMLIGSDPESDICVLAVIGELTPVQFYTDSDELQAGENVIAFGNPFGTVGGTVTRGILSSSVAEVPFNNDSVALLQTDAPVSYGNNGGGLFTDTGFFIGMINTSYSDFFNNVNNVAFAVPSNAVELISTQLVQTRTDETPGYIEGKYILGCVVETVYENRWGTKTYIQVSSLDSSGSAIKSGLKVGDVINSIKYNDVITLLTTQNMFVEFTESTTFKIGDKLTFNVTRDGTRMDVEVQILQYIYGDD